MHAGDPCLHQGSGGAAAAGRCLAVRLHLPGYLPTDAGLRAVGHDSSGPPQQGTDCMYLTWVE